MEDILRETWYKGPLLEKIGIYKQTFENFYEFWSSNINNRLCYSVSHTGKIQPKTV